MDKVEKFRKIYYKDRETIAARLEQLSSRTDLTQEERDQLDYEWKNYNDYYNTLDTAFEEGYLQGLEEARKEILEEARKEGRMEVKRSIAIMLKKQGVSTEIIATSTGLSPEEMNAL